MDRPARLPITQDELDEWSVYADWLQSRGDPRGERIALELALPAAPAPAALAAFQARGATAVPAGEGIVPTLALGYIQALTVARASGTYTVEAEALERARALLVTEAGALVEEVDFAFDPGKHLRAAGALLAALPPTCRRLGLDLCGPISDDAAAELAAHLPPHVRELALRAYGVRLARIGLTGMLTWIDDRFDAVEVRFKRSTFDVALGHLQVDRARLAERAGQARHVRQRWTAIDAPFPPGRVEVGRPGEAALVDLRRRFAIALSRPGAVEHGEDRAPPPLPIRALRAGHSREGHGAFLYATDEAEPGLALRSASVALDRHGDAWTLTHHAWQADGGAIRVDGAAVAPGESVPIHDGSLIHSEHWTFTLVTADVTATVRGLLA
ncbi:MAG TPA: hypothetical protein VNO30_27560 [Kofleriaceae bacterium]|nr:hypothetical protein [Kofleriaceae bacterium]